MEIEDFKVFSNKLLYKQTNIKIKAYVKEGVKNDSTKDDRSVKT